MKKYLECSRSPWYSLIFVLPLWLAYEALNAAYNFGQKRQILVPRFLLNLEIGGMKAPDFGLQFMGSLGAGVYEELLFRVLIMGGLTLLGVRLLRMKPGPAVVGAMVISSLIFSGFHYLGPL